MLETVSVGNGQVRIRATVRKAAVYLDTFAIIELARHDPDRRARFFALLEEGADVMFSTANAAEIVATQSNDSIATLRAFLDGIGPYWIPVEAHGIATILDREKAGAEGQEACVSEWFLQRLFTALNLVQHGEQRLELVEPSFFRLSIVFDWIADHHRMANQEASVRIETTVFDQLRQVRTAYEANPNALDHAMPLRTYDPARPATFTFYSLLRLVTLEAKSRALKKGDAADLLHATVAASYAHFAALDRHWKGRIDRLPKPNGLARIYYAPELDQMVDDLAAFLKATA